MKVVFPSFDPTASTTGSFVNLLPGWRGNLVVQNPSPVNLIFVMNDDRMRIPAQQITLIPLTLNKSPARMISWQQENILNNNDTDSAMNLVMIDGFSPEEHIGMNYPIPLNRTVYNQALPSTIFSAQINATTGGTTGNLACSQFLEADIFLMADTFVGGTSPNVQFGVYSVDPFGIQYQLTTATIPSGGNPKAVALGVGGNPAVPIGTQLLVTYNPGGSPTSFRVTINIIGK